MKYCEECGAQLEDNALFCEECGTKQSTEYAKDNEKNENNVGMIDPKEVKKKNGKTMIILGIIMALVVIICVIFVIQKKQNAKETTSSDTTNSSQEGTLFETLSWTEEDVNAKMIGSLKLTDYWGKAIKNAIEEKYSIEEIKSAEDADKLYVYYKFSDKSDTYEIIISSNDESDNIVEELYKNTKRLKDEQMDKFCKETFLKEDDENKKEESEEKSEDNTSQETETSGNAEGESATSPMTETTTQLAEDYSAKYSYLRDIYIENGSDFDDFYTQYSINIMEINGDKVHFIITGEYLSSKWEQECYGTIQGNKIVFDTIYGNEIKVGYGEIYIPESTSSELAFILNLTVDEHFFDNDTDSYFIYQTTGLRYLMRMNPYAN